MARNDSKYIPRLIAWEVTRRCRLKCRHCRAGAEDREYADEFTTEEIKKTLSNIASFAKPIIILTGGEPMVREDIYDIARYGDSLGLRMVMAPCGSLVTSEAISQMKSAGIKRISLSIDGATKESHDSFRGVEGSFDDAVSASRAANKGGMPFQINTTVTKMNISELPEIMKLAAGLGAVSFHPFLLVPTGRGKDLSGSELSAREYEETLKWIYEAAKQVEMTVKPTCAPHYFRIKDQMGGTGKDGGLDHSTRGCLGGTGFAFISHTGTVQICGFLDVVCGDVRKSDYNFKKIWEESEVFNKLRNPGEYKGKCGICEYHAVCGGCRARVFAKTGSYLSPEPYCIYIPRQKPHPPDLLTALQDEIPITSRPFLELAKRFDISENDLIKKINDWHKDGLIRHLSAHINSGALGFDSALVAMSVPGEKIDETSRVISSHPGVSHSYLRDHHFNVWFTIKVPQNPPLPLGESGGARGRLDRHVEFIIKRAGIDNFLILPAIKTFKLNVKFDAFRRQGLSEKQEPQAVAGAQEITKEEEAVIEEMAYGLLLVADPFHRASLKLNMPEENLLGTIRDLQKRGVIKKIRIVLNHYKLGIKANAMVVWDVPRESLGEVGRLFADQESITHCYERARFDEFPYNLYTMIHADSDGSLSEIIKLLASRAGIGSYAILKSVRELLKRKTTFVREKYFLWGEE